MTRLIYHLQTNTRTTFTIPSTVEIIDFDAFAMSKLTSLDIHDAVREIGAYAFVASHSMTTISKLKDLFLYSRLMPAFPVSLHNETLDALRQGQWLKLSFTCRQNVNGLLFDGLLFQLNVTAGINLIREYEGKYEGRCLFLDFDETENLQNLIK